MNGFDVEDMRIREDEGTGIKEERFTLTYTGNFKPNQHIPAIWDGIIEMLKEDEDLAKVFRLRFVGNVDDSTPNYFKEKGFESNVELVSYVPHAEVTRIMTTSSLLLFYHILAANFHNL